MIILIEEGLHTQRYKSIKMMAKESFEFRDLNIQMCIFISAKC